MAQQNINVGTVPNDGTGDTLRAAFIKAQNNFSEFYAALSPTLASNNVALANNLTLGNTTVNGVINSTALLLVSNTTVNTFMNGTSIAVGTSFLANTSLVNAISYTIGATYIQNSTAYSFGNSTSQFFINSTGYWIGNSTVNVSTNSTHFFSGNSTVNAYGNSTAEVIANSTSQFVMTPLTYTIGNSTANAYGNSTFKGITNSTANYAATPSSLVIDSAAANLVVGNSTTYVIANNGGLTVSTNTFNLGTANVAGHTLSLANGYIHLPGGLMWMFGTYTGANSTANVQTFSTLCGAAFTINAFAVWATANNNATTVAITAVNSTSLTLQTNNATAQTVYWHAIGL